MSLNRSAQAFHPIIFPPDSHNRESQRCDQSGKLSAGLVRKRRGGRGVCADAVRGSRKVWLRPIRKAHLARTGKTSADLASPGSPGLAAHLRLGGPAILPFRQAQGPELAERLASRTSVTSPMPDTKKLTKHGQSPSDSASGPPFAPGDSKKRPAPISPPHRCRQRFRNCSLGSRRGCGSGEGCGSGRATKVASLFHLARARLAAHGRIRGVASSRWTGATIAATYEPSNETAVLHSGLVGGWRTGRGRNSRAGTDRGRAV